MVMLASSQPRSGRTGAALLDEVKEEVRLADRDRSEWRRVATAEEAVSELEHMHASAVGALRDSLKAFFADGHAPDAAARRKFRYPELRITYAPREAPATTRRAFAKFPTPGHYTTTIT